MVDIIIGAIPPSGVSNNKSGTTAVPIEAELLHVRDPRHRSTAPVGEERRRQPRQDPVKGKVLTILIPDSTALPRDLDIKKYKVLLRFMKK